MSGSDPWAIEKQGSSYSTTRCIASNMFWQAGRSWRLSQELLSSGPIFNSSHCNPFVDLPSARSSNGLSRVLRDVLGMSSVNDFLAFWDSFHRGMSWNVDKFWPDLIIILHFGVICVLSTYFFKSKFGLFHPLLEVPLYHAWPLYMVPGVYGRKHIPVPHGGIDPRWLRKIYITSSHLLWYLCKCLERLSF